MSMKSNSNVFWKKYWLILFLILFVVLAILSISLYDPLMRKWFGFNYEKSGQFGDQFGAVNALFSGLAFLGLILTIIFQTYDINLQRDDLKLQTKALLLQNEALNLQIQEFKEQRIELARSAKSQEQSNILNLTSMKIHLGNMHLEMDLERIKMMGDVGDRLKNIEIIEDRIEQSYKELHQLEELLGLNVPDNGDHSDPTTKA